MIVLAQCMHACMYVYMERELHHILFKVYSVHIKINIVWKMMHKQVSMVIDTVASTCVFQFSFVLQTFWSIFGLD